MARDKLIIVSTHILEEVSAVCTRAVIIARGRIVADDTPQGLAARSRYHDAVSFTLDDDAALEPARAALASLPAVAAVELQLRERRLTALPREPGPTLQVAVAEWAAQQRLALRDLRLESGRLDDVFRSITA
jgi:ABC-2 type transport system ATP-binding protein